MRFTLTTSYTDGKPGPITPARLALTPGVGQPGHHVGTNGGNVVEERLFADAVEDATRGPSIFSIGGWVVAGLLLLGAFIYWLRGRHRAEEDDEPDDEEHQQTDSAEETKEPVAAGKWSFRG
jgi:hypothetical protein